MTSSASRTARLKKAGLVVAFALLALVLVAIVASRTGAVRGYLLRKGQEYLRAQGIGLEAARLELDLTRMALGLEQVELTSLAAPELPPFLSVEKAHVNLDVSRSLQGAIALDQALFERLRLHLVVAENGENNLPRGADEPQPGPSSQPSSIPDFLVSRGRIEEGSLLYEDRSRDIRAEIPAFRLALDGEAVSLDHELRWSGLEGGTIAMEGRSLPVGELLLEGRLSPERLLVEELRLGIGRSRIEGQGTIRDFSNPELDLEARAELDLEEAVALARPETAVGGRAEAALSIAGPADALRVSADLTGTDLAFEEWPRADLAARALWDSAEAAVHVSSLSLSSPAGRLSGHGRIGLQPAAGESSFEAELQRVDLRALSRAAGAPTEIASLAEGRLEARWPDFEVERADGSAALALAATESLPEKDVLPVSGNLQTTAREGTVVLRVVDLEALGAELAGEAVLRAGGADRDYAGGALDGNLRLRAPSLELVAERASRLRGAAVDSLPEPPLEGSATVGIDLGGTPRAPRVAVALEAEEVRLGELQDLRASARAEYAADSLRIYELTIGTPEQQLLSARGEIGLGESDAPLRLAAEAREVPLAPVLSTFAGSAPVEGELSLEASVAGTRSAPSGEIDLRVENLQAYGETLGSLSGAGELQGRERARLELRLDKPQEGGSGTLLADASFVPRTEAYQLQVQSDDLRIENLQIPNLGSVRGALAISASGSGTFDDPELQLELEGQDLALAGRELGELRLFSRVADASARAELELPRLALSGAGDVALESPYPATFELSARGTDLSRLPLDLQDLSGTLSAGVRGSGNLERPEESTVELEVRDLAVSLRDQLVGVQEPMRIRYEDRALAVDSAALVSGSSTLELEGVLPLQEEAGTGELSLTGDVLLSDVAALAPPEIDLSAEGRLSLQGSLSGSLERLDPRVSVRVEGGSVASSATTEPVSGIDLRIEMAGGVVSWESLTAQMGPARLQSTGELPLSVLADELPFGMEAPEAPMELALELRDFQLGLLADLPERLDGVISLDVRAQAPGADLERLQASVTFPELAVETGGYRIEQTTTTRISVQQGVARIEMFQMAGEQTRLDVTGSAPVSGSGPVELQTRGFTELAALASGMDDLQAAGTAQFDVTVGGTTRDPSVSGFASLEGAQLALEEPEIAANDLTARLSFQGDRLEIQEMRGELNGGTLSASGGASLRGGELTEVDLALETEGVYLEFPIELQTITDTDLRIVSQDGGIVVGGDVAVLRGSYSEPLEIEDEVLDRLRHGGDPEIPQERNPFLSRIRYDMGLSTLEPIVMDNNLADMALTFELQLSGTYYRPGLTGRIDLEEGGEIYLRENTYVLERGTVTFLNETRIEPALDVLARTQAGDYDIALAVTGVAGDLETTLTSEPPLPEADILAVLATGRTLEEFRGQEVHVAQEQFLSYLAGRSAGRITRGIEQSLGLSEVRVEPNLVSAESDPTARLTIGQEVAPDLRLVYSVNLTDSSDRIYIAEYEATRRFTTMVTQQEDNSYRFDIRHRLQFGGGPESGHPSDRPGPRTSVRVGAVVFSGNDTLPDPTLAEIFGLRTGDRYDFFQARDAADEVAEGYRERGYLEVRTDLERVERDGEVDLTLEIEEGPPVRFLFTGAPVPDGVREQVRQAWSDGFFDRQRGVEASEAIQAFLMKDGHLEARVDYTIEHPPDSAKSVRFLVEPGIGYEHYELRIEGGEGIEESRREEVLDALDAKETIHTDPERVAEALTDLYASEGYLDVEVAGPRYELDPEARSAAVVLEIREGPAYVVQGVELQGNRSFSDERLLRAASLAPDAPYRLEDRREAISEIERFYWEHGYNDVQVAPAAFKDESEAEVRLVFDIVEGRREVVRDVVIEGTDRTSESFVRSELEIAPGEVLNLDELSASRQNLYHTGAFATVEMERVAGAADNGEKPVTLRVQVREQQPFSLRYGASYDTETGPGAILDFVNRNSLGSARTLGVRGRYDGWLREARVYFSQPTLRRFPLSTNATLFYAREYLSREEGEELISSRQGFSIDQELQLRNRYVFSAGYRYEWNEVAALVSDSDLEGILAPHVTAPLTATLTRDTRDEILDATEGSFSSQAVEIAPEFLGSDMGYLRYFGQYNAYLPLSEPTEIPWVGIAKSRWVYAGSVRLGLAGGLGGPEIPVARRFFAGGGTSIRGFEHNALGPITGSNAVFITNHEIRFPLVSIFDGVGFLDMGNVFESVGDVDFLSFRESAGIGLRIRTPYVLLRLDYAFKLDARPDEPGSSLFFSIGQAF